MKVIFLDIDGVLNYQGCPERFNGMYFVNEEAVQRLQTIVIHTGAKIVLSSSWREGWYDQEAGIESEARDLFEALVDKLAEYNLELYDKTDRLGTFRGDEILKWIDDNFSSKGDFLDQYVILDDLPPKHFGAPLADHFIRTDFYNGGLTIRLAGKAIHMLKKEEGRD